MQDFPELYVIRHGQTVWNAEGRHQGQLDSPLTDLGLAQARDLGALLKAERSDWSGVAAYASPTGRAARTAQIALDQIGLTATHDDRLKEVAFGRWEGRTLEEIEADTPGCRAAFEADPLGFHFESPGGETLAQLMARCSSFLSDLSGPSILVCHGITSRVLRSIVLDLDLDGMRALPGGQGNIHHIANGRWRVIEN